MYKVQTGIVLEDVSNQHFFHSQWNHKRGANDGSWMATVFQTNSTNIADLVLLRRVQLNLQSRAISTSFWLCLYPALKYCPSTSAAHSNRTLDQQFVDDNITKTRAKIELLSLCEPVVTPLPQDSIEPTEYECAVIMAIMSLLPYLYDCDMKRLSEAHLTFSYVHPFMYGLLSAKKPSKVVHCSNIVPEEFEDAVDRPDYKIDVYASSGYRFSYTDAYGKVKKSSDVSVALLAKDFYRLCILF